MVSKMHERIPCDCAREHTRLGKRYRSSERLNAVGCTVTGMGRGCGARHAGSRSEINRD